MKIYSLYIEKYMKFEKQEIIFNEFKEKTSLYQKELFGKMNINLFCGLNGSGKTSILSFIAIIFRYLQRYRERIPCNYKIHYNITRKNNKFDIQISKIEQKIMISINGIESEIMKYDLKKGYIEDLNSNLKQVTYEEIQSYLPDKVIVLGFDLPYSKNKLNYGHNYKGDRLIEYVNINKVYRESEMGMDLSSGILDFFVFLKKNKNFMKILKSLGFNFNWRIDIHFNFLNMLELNSFYKKKFIETLDSDKFSKKKLIEDLLLTEYQKERIKIYEEGLKKFDEIYYNEEFWKKKENGYIKEMKVDDVQINLLKIFSNKKTLKAFKYLVKNNFIYINGYYLEKEKKEIALNQMSTGEKSFLYYLFFIISRVTENSIVVWEEPETHLNKTWSRELITILSILYKKCNVHFLISSHETTMINCLFSNQIKILKETKIEFPDFETFLVNENEIIFKFFGKDKPSFFENYIINIIKKSREEELETLLNNIGDSFLKFLIYQKLHKGKNNVES